MTTDGNREKGAPPPKKPLKADYRGATPRQVGEAVLRRWSEPKPKPKNKRWLR